MIKIFIATILLITFSLDAASENWKYAAVRGSDNMQVDIDYDSINFEGEWLSFQSRHPAEKGLKNLFSNTTFIYEGYAISCDQNKIKWLSSVEENKLGAKKVKFTRSIKDTESIETPKGSLLEVISTKVCKEFNVGQTVSQTQSKLVPSGQSKLVPSGIKNQSWQFVDYGEDYAFTHWLSKNSIKKISNDTYKLLTKSDYKTTQSLDGGAQYKSVVYQSVLNCSQNKSDVSALELFDANGELVENYYKNEKEIKLQTILKESFTDYIKLNICDGKSFEEQTGQKEPYTNIVYGKSELLPDGLNKEDWVKITTENNIHYFAKKGSLERKEDVITFITGVDFDKPTASPSGKQYKYSVESSFINCKTNMYSSGHKEYFDENGDYKETFKVSEEDTTPRPIKSTVGKKYQEVLCAIDLNNQSGLNNAPANSQESFSTGTSWQISKNHLITAYHVVSGADNIAVVINDSDIRNAEIVSFDASNDLAMIKISGNPMRTQPLALAQSPSKIGSKIAVIGYPLPNLLGTKIQANSGEISALFGIKNDPRYYQISAAVQGGNSGSPVLNQKGEVIGVVASKLDDIETLKNSGELPQNVNFAVKNLYVQSLVESSNVKLIKSQRKITPIEDVIEQMKNSVFLVITSRNNR